MGGFYTPSNSYTIYPESAQAPQVKGSVPRDRRHFGGQSQVWAPGAPAVLTGKEGGP